MGGDKKRYGRHVGTPCHSRRALRTIPSGDLIHHPDKLDGVLPVEYAFLATDLLHHPLEADGVEGEL